MATEIVVTDEFRVWYEALTAKEQDRVTFYVELLMEAGTSLDFPHSSGVSSKKFPSLRELRIQYAGQPYRVLYAFDPIRQAVLLVGGNKTGKGRWYVEAIHTAERLLEEYLRGL
jgi:hypothetical protein